MGPNGAGKTTLLRLIAGDLPLSSGSAMVAGHHVGKRAARRLVGYAADPPVLPSELTGVEWLEYLASHRSAHAEGRTTVVQWAVEFAALEAFGGRRIADYSRGMVQRLALAGAAVTGSAALVLDEVLNGADPLVASRLRLQVSELAASGKIVMIASHDLAALEKLATRVLLLWQGRLVADLSVAQLLTERVAELSLNGWAASSTARLMERFPGSVQTGEGVAIPLSSGLTVEKILATCRACRVAVAASRVRYRALEDILHEVASRHGQDRE